MTVVTKVVPTTDVNEVEVQKKRATGPVLKTSDLVKILVDSNVDLTNSQQLRVVRVIASEIKKNYPRFSENVFFNSILEKSKKVRTKKELAAYQKRKSLEGFSTMAPLEREIKKTLEYGEVATIASFLRETHLSAREVDTYPVTGLFIPVHSYDMTVQLFCTDYTNPCISDSASYFLKPAYVGRTLYWNYQRLFKEYVEPGIRGMCELHGVYYTDSLAGAATLSKEYSRKVPPPNVREFVSLLVKEYREGLTKLLQWLESEKNSVIVPRYDEDEEVASLINYFEKEGAN